MFLAKGWKIVKGKRYPFWSLKRSVWDKETKRQKQVYLAYIGTSKRISLEKAHQIIDRLGISLEELRKVRGLSINEVRPEAAVSAPQEEPAAPPGISAPQLIGELRKRLGVGETRVDYQMLAVRVGVIHINAEQLKLAEEGSFTLSPTQRERIEAQLELLRRKTNPGGSGEESRSDQPFE